MLSNRWFILAVLFVTRFCLGYQFQSAGSVAPFLISEFALDYRQVGILVGLFMLPGLLLALPSGLLAKHFGDKPIVLMGMAAMVLGGLLSGVAQSYAVINAGRLIIGVGAVFLVVL
jgi:predicted MFS family arabinose efflux permease